MNQENLMEAGKEVREIVDRTKEAVSNEIETLERAVKTRPLLSLGFAFGIGVIVSKLFCASR